MSALEKCLWTVLVMSYWCRRRDFNTLSGFQYQSYSSSMIALLCPHIHGGCLSWFLLGMQVYLYCSTSSWEGSVPPRTLHCPSPSCTLRGLPLLSQNMRDLTLALFLRNHSPIQLPGNGPKSSADVGFFSSWSPFQWLLFWSHYIAEEECVYVIIFMSWGLISLDRLLVFSVSSTRNLFQWGYTRGEGLLSTSDLSWMMFVEHRSDLRI